MSDADQLLAELGSHPGWPILHDRAKRQMDLFFMQLAREFASANKRPDYETLQWKRGFFAGMKFLLDNPTVEAKRLAKALAQEDEVS